MTQRWHFICVGTEVYQEGYMGHFSTHLSTCDASLCKRFHSKNRPDLISN